VCSMYEISLFEEICFVTFYKSITIHYVVLAPPSPQMYRCSDVVSCLILMSLLKYFKRRMRFNACFIFVPYRPLNENVERDIEDLGHFLKD
jgi:hypothetical protein